MLISSRILLFPYYLLFVIGLLLPSDGTHGILSPKSLAFLLASASIAALILIKQAFKISHLLLGVFICLYLAFIIAWMIIGAANPVTQWSGSVDQAKLFLITLSVPLFTAYLKLENFIDCRYLIRIIILSNFAYCLAKLILISLHVLGILDVWNLLGSTGFKVMSMKIFSNLERLQTSVDISTPFIFMFVLFSNRLGVALSPKIRGIYLAVATISNFFTFSRFLLFIQAAAFCLYILSLNTRQFLRVLAVATTLIAISVISIGLDNASASIDQRFFSSANARSDDMRVDQIHAMLDHYNESPYLGAGMGAHAPKLIRSPIQFHIYEVQWVSFLMQFGLLGILFLFLMLLTLAAPLLTPPFSRTKFAFLALFGLWILSGFTNPFLISLQSGIIYALFLLAGWVLVPNHENF